jgi:hypothetical protein
MTSDIFLIRVPMHQSDRASGEYEDFVTGFAIDNGHAWGRPRGCHRGSGWLAADNRGRLELHLARQLYGYDHRPEIHAWFPAHTSSPPEMAWSRIGMLWISR